MGGHAGHRDLCLQDSLSAYCHRTGFSTFAVKCRCTALRRIFHEFYTGIAAVRSILFVGIENQADGPMIAAAVFDRIHGQQRHGNTALAVIDAGSIQDTILLFYRLRPKRANGMNCIHMRQKRNRLANTFLQLYQHHVAGVFLRCPCYGKAALLRETLDLIGHAVHAILRRGRRLYGRDLLPEFQIIWNLSIDIRKNPFHMILHYLGFTTWQAQ